MTQSKLQKLIDITFEIAYHSRNYTWENNQKHMEWVAEQLRQCGYDTEPRGCSWGVLK